MLLPPFRDKLFNQLCQWECREIAIDSKLYQILVLRDILLLKWAFPQLTLIPLQLGIIWDLPHRWWLDSKDLEWLPNSLIQDTASNKATPQCFSKNSQHLMIVPRELLSLLWEELVRLMISDTKLAKQKTLRESLVLWDLLPPQRLEGLKQLCCKADHFVKLWLPYFTNWKKNWDLKMLILHSSKTEMSKMLLSLLSAEKEDCVVLITQKLSSKLSKELKSWDQWE